MWTGFAPRNSRQEIRAAQLLKANHSLYCPALFCLVVKRVAQPKHSRCRLSVPLLVRFTHLSVRPPISQSTHLSVRPPTFRSTHFPVHPPLGPVRSIHLTTSWTGPPTHLLPVYPLSLVYFSLLDHFGGVFLGIPPLEVLCLRTYGRGVNSSCLHHWWDHMSVMSD